MRRGCGALCALLLFIGGSATTAHAAGDDPLPAWNDGETKRALVSFVTRVTTPGTPDFVPAPERIAVFDNDGTLWPEQPMYTQLAFALARVRALVPQHPEWRTQSPFKEALAGDLAGIAASGPRGVMRLMVATETGMSTEAFERTVLAWLATARQPRFQRPYTALAYLPMLQLLAYLRANGFRTFIVSGGGADFMRPWTEPVYGIPPEQVVGSTVAVKFEERGGEPTLLRLPEIDFIDDKAGKPVGIYRYIGRRPLVAFGNSDGDLQMLQYAAAGAHPHFVVLIHHTDGVREYAYDRHAQFGRLDVALDQARAKGWTVVDMKRDWRIIFPPER